MPFHHAIRGERFAFADLRDLFARANEEKSGDCLAGIAARSERERVAAKLALADVRLGDILDQPLLEDDVTRLILDTHDPEAFAPFRPLTVGEFREYLLSDDVGETELRRLQPAVTPEI